jgi:hypothetical protein
MAAAQAAAVAAAADTIATGQRLSTIANGFVGQANPLAGEYHCSDYDWQQHAEETAPLVEAQWAGAPAAVRDAAVLDAAGRPLSAVAQLLQRLQTGGPDADGQSNGNGHVVPTAQLQQLGSTFSSTVVTLEQPIAAAAVLVSNQDSPSSSSSEENEWEVFYRAHPAAKFFKERRYLLLEFPCLAPPSQLQHVVEIGAGCGSSTLPGGQAIQAAAAHVVVDWGFQPPVQFMVTATAAAAAASTITRVQAALFHKPTADVVCMLLPTVLSCSPACTAPGARNTVRHQQHMFAAAPAGHAAPGPRHITC